MKHLMDCNKTLRKQSVDIHLQLFYFWSQPDPGWVLQLMLNISNTVSLADIELKKDLGGAESHLRYILWELTHLAKSYNIV